MDAISLHICETFRLKNYNEKKFYCLLHQIHSVGIMSQRLTLATFEKDKKINAIGNCWKSCPDQRGSFYPIFAPVVAKLVNRKRKKYIASLFSLKVFWLFKHISSSFCLQYFKVRILFALLLEDALLKLKTWITFKKMGVFLVLHCWVCHGSCCLQRHFFPYHLIFHRRSISLKPDTDFSAEIFEKGKEKTSWCLWFLCSSTICLIRFTW